MAGRMNVSNGNRISNGKARFVDTRALSFPVRDGRSRGVRALFLPQVIRGQDARVSVEELVVNHVPNRIAYRFDEVHVLSELEYYGVAEPDRPWVVKALARIGIMPYVTDDRRTVVFKVGVEDGAFAARVVHQPRRRGK